MHAQMYKHSDWIAITDVHLLQERFGELIKQAGFKVLNVSMHNFEPVGFTCLYLLAESHFAIHTFPEAGRTFIELSSCNQEKFVSFISKLPKFIAP